MATPLVANGRRITRPAVPSGSATAVLEQISDVPVMAIADSSAAAAAARELAWAAMAIALDGVAGSAELVAAALPSIEIRVANRADAVARASAVPSSASWLSTSSSSASPASDSSAAEPMRRQAVRSWAVVATKPVDVPASGRPVASAAWADVEIDADAANVDVVWSPADAATAIAEAPTSLSEDVRLADGPLEAIDALAASGNELVRPAEAAAAAADAPARRMDETKAAVAPVEVLDELPTSGSDDVMPADPDAAAAAVPAQPTWVVADADAADAIAAVPASEVSGPLVALDCQKSFQTWARPRKCDQRASRRAIYAASA